MNKFKHFRPAWHHKLNIFVLAFIFIAVGILLLGSNLGLINPGVYHFIVSWQMLLIVLGIVQLIKQHYIGGAILIFTGGYFLFPQLSEMGGEWIAVYWPVIFILIGILILIKRWNHKPGQHHFHGKNVHQECITEDGFVKSEVAFGSVHQIVLDPIFKGAKIDNSFGSTVVDLRRSRLVSEETFIDINCSFGSIELYIPPSWNVYIETDTSLSGASDKRFRPGNIETDLQHKLIIRGDLSFSGLEIKS